MQFRQAVDKLANPVRCVVFFAVPFFICAHIAQSKICGQVHDARRERGIVLDFFLRLAVRQREKYHVARDDLIGRGELHFGASAQIGVDVVEIFAHVRF